MGGPRVTPKELETAARVFAETGNASEAARAVGRTESTIRAAFKAERIARIRDLHTLRLERGLRDARKQIVNVSRLLERVFDAESPEALGLEPADIAKLVQAFNGTVAQRIALADRDDRGRQAELLRRKTRAETKLLRMKASGAYVDRVSVEGMSDDELDRRIAELERSRERDDEHSDEAPADGR